MTTAEVTFVELEDDSAAITAFVDRHNARTEAAFKDAAFEQDVAKARALLEDEDQINGLIRRGTWLYTFRQTLDHPRGLWMRRPESGAIDAKDGWGTVFDLDAFCAQDGGDWHWRGAVTAFFDPDRVLILLSAGGSDQTRFIEFDCAAGAPVSGGFDFGPERGSVAWEGPDSLLWASSRGDDATSSSWPGVVRRLTRDGGLGAAEALFSAEKDHLTVHGYTTPTADQGRLACVSHFTEIGHERVTVLDPDGAYQIPSPPDTTVLNTATHYAYCVQKIGGVPGALMLGALPDGTAREVWRPGERQAIQDGGLLLLNDWLLWIVQDNLRPALWALSLADPSATPQIITPPEAADTFWISLHDDDFRVDSGTASAPLQLNLSGFLTPPATYVFDLDRGVEGIEWRLLWRQPQRFDPGDNIIELREAISDDGTRVPYHLVRSANASPAPTLIYGYGGFGVSIAPGYHPVLGSLWLERGGAYALAHIRGGGELGPDWHLSAKGPNRRRAFDDLAAIAHDLHDNNLSTPAQTACRGASNGGLLTGVMLTQYPGLFGAIWSSVGVYDMARFHNFPAGRAWIDEYGDPDDPEALQWLLDYSPMHNVRAVAGRDPAALIDTSANDDRVDPSHARRFAATLEAAGRTPWFYQHKGGHGGGGSSRDLARETALGYRFLVRSLGMEQ